MKRLGLIFGGVLSLVAKAAFATTIFLTSGAAWNVPADWDSTRNSIEIVAAGGAGDVHCFSSTSNTGGGGGAYAKVSNVALTPGASVPVSFGNGFGSTTAFNGTTVVAENGYDGTDCALGGVGGRASASTGTTKFSGGNGSNAPGGGVGTGAGGGAAGPHGAGGNAVPQAYGGDGGAGDAGFGGAGGIGSGSGDGGNGTEWDASHGSGGGAGGGTGGGGNGGLYGGGGSVFVAGRGALIVITYTPRRHRVSSGVF